MFVVYKKLFLLLPEFLKSFSASTPHLTLSVEEFWHSLYHLIRKVSC